MEIALYYTHPFETGGVEKTMLERGRMFKSLGHNITYVFNKATQTNMLEQWSEIGDVIKDEYVDKHFDWAIYDSLYGNKLVQADDYIQIINGNVIDGQENLCNDIPFSKYITVSEGCRNQLIEKFGIESEVIPNIIDTERIKELAKEKYDIPKKKYNFVVVSRIDPVKFELTAKFIELIDKKTKDYQFVIVGSNNNFPNYINRMKDRLSKCNVIWEGLQNNPYKYIKNADYLVQLSEYESQCMVMYESLSLGTPVIVTDFPNAVKDVTDKRGFVLKKDFSNLNIDTILNKKGSFKFEYKYPDVKQKWIDILKPYEKKDIKFSIIIPNYNNSEWLDKCLLSVANQTYKNYEVIFIDDMSTDDSIKIANKYIEKIKEFKIIELNQKRYNGGARNLGILEAEGDYTLFIDSDDWLKDNEVLEKLNKFIRNEDLIRLGYSLSDGKKDNLFIDIPKAKTLLEVFREDTCACWTKVIKTSILKQVLFPEGTLCEDRVWHDRLIEKCKTFRNFPEVTHVWNRANKHSTTTAKSIEWETSCYKHLGEMYKFINTTKNEEYKKIVQNKFKVHKNNLERGVYTQL